MDKLFHLNPAFALAILQALIGFLVKSSLSLVAVALLSRLIASPARRFALCFAYLVGAALYALSLAIPLALTLRIQAATSSSSPWSRLERLERLEPAAWSHHIAPWTLPSLLATHLSAAVALLCLFYLAAVSAGLLFEHRRQSRLRRALLFSFDPSAEILQLFDTLASSLRLSDSRVLILPGLASPATVGWLKPLILLPALFDSSSELAQQQTQTADILLHELHHIRRRDWLLDHIAQAIRTLLFFHPAIWIACRRLRQEREFACDQAVIGGRPEMRARYAESLVRFARFTARSNKNTAACGVDFAASAGHLSIRVNAILAAPGDAPLPPGSAVLKSLAGTGLLLALAFALSAITLPLALPAVLGASSALAAAARVSQPVTHPRAAVRPAFHTARPSNAVNAFEPAAPIPATSPTHQALFVAGLAPQSDAPERPHFKLEPAADTEDEPIADELHATGSDPAILARASNLPSSDLSVGRIPLTYGNHSGSSSTVTIPRTPVSRGHH